MDSKADEVDAAVPELTNASTVETERAKAAHTRVDFSSAAAFRKTMVSSRLIISSHMLAILHVENSELTFRFPPACSLPASAQRSRSDFCSACLPVRFSVGASPAPTRSPPSSPSEGSTRPRRRPSLCEHSFVQPSPLLASP